MGPDYSIPASSVGRLCQCCGREKNTVWLGSDECSCSDHWLGLFRWRSQPRAPSVWHLESYADWRQTLPCFWPAVGPRLEGPLLRIQSAGGGPTSNNTGRPWYSPDPTCSGQSQSLKTNSASLLAEGVHNTASAVTARPSFPQSDRYTQVY